MAYTQRGSVLTAADAAASDTYGQSVSVSSNGLVLAIGAGNWEGTLTNQGGVYIYDWSGSAWVARGSVLTAADAGSSDFFGASVALSADGTILAVGATGWEGPVSNQGGVYLFDWSGSAWVQRGSVLTASDAGSGDSFGVAVALSDNGDILAVGANLWDGLTDEGAVYTFDRNGTGWIQRTPVLQAYSQASFNEAGNGVALSGAGDVLVMGVPARDQTYSNQGGVYVYDWSGSAWVIRNINALTAVNPQQNDFFGMAVAISSDGNLLAVGAHQFNATAPNNKGRVQVFTRNGSGWTQSGSDIVAADGAADDRYGRAVAMSADGGILVVGSFLWEGSLTDQGGVYVYDSATGQSEAPTRLDIIATGISTAPTDLLVVAYGTAAAPTALTLVNPTGISVASTQLDMIGYGQATAQTMLAMVDLAAVQVWTASVIIGGVDLSSSVQGRVVVTADEGGARIASVSIVPDSGTVAPLDYVGKSVVIDFVALYAGVPVPRRMITGLVDHVEFNLADMLLELSCTDNLQHTVAQMNRADLDAIIGGKYSAAVQGDIADNWEYAQARMTTVAGSLDAGPAGGIRVTPWEIGATWKTYTASSLLFRESAITYPERRTLINEVNIEYQYRYNRLRQRFAGYGWSGSPAEMAASGFRYPNQASLIGSATGSGWEYAGGIFVAAPTRIPYQGKFAYPNRDGIESANIKLTQRHAQTITDNYELTVTAPLSITANGRLPSSLRGALESKFSGQAWESAYDMAPLMPDGGEQDYSPDATRADSDYAIETLLDQARVKIHGSHRSARVKNAVLCDPEIDLDKKIEINTALISASGKVVNVQHALDIDSGSAISEFSIACFSLSGNGVITPDSLTPPAAPPEKIGSTGWIGELPNIATSFPSIRAYSDDLNGVMLNTPKSIRISDANGDEVEYVDNPSYTVVSYPMTGFRVSMPGVADEDREPFENLIADQYQIEIPSDPITFTIP